MLLWLLSENPSTLSVAFIPTAADLYADKWFVDADKNALLELGFRIEMADIKNEDTGNITQKLQSADIIFVAGGNTFYLLQELQRKGIDKLIIQLVNDGKLYIWSSAWSIVAGPNIEIATDVDEPSEAPELASPIWLHITDYVILPHCDSVKYKETTEKILQAYQNYKHPIIRLGDYQAVYIENDQIAFVENKQ